MSLTKLFNFKYMKQNLKKSKGQLLLFLSAIPVFTFLLMFFLLNSFPERQVDQMNIMLINICGMYILPIILSICLFDYIYKEKSVDLINSMPMSKKTIFLSNTLLGIILIVVMQFINMIGLLLIKAIFPNAILFFGMIFDAFILMTVGYIFVFICTNISISICGNIMTTIITTMVILFLIPFTFSMLNFDNFIPYEGESYTYNLTENGKILGRMNVTKDPTDTLPFLLIRTVLNYGRNETLYNTKSIVKTIFVSVLYIILGTYIFKKRKFENVGQSFRSKYFHSTIKAITMYPVIALLCQADYLSYETSLILLIFAFFIFYYFIYDVITSKKNKFLYSVCTLVLTLILLNGIGYGMVKYNSYKSENLKEIKKEDITGIAIGPLNNKESYYSKYLQKDNKTFNYFMNPDKFIDYIYYLPYDEDNKITVSSTQVNSQVVYSKNTLIANSGAKIKLKNGKEMFVDLYITIDLDSYINQLSDKDIIQIESEKQTNNKKEELYSLLKNDEEWMRLNKEELKKQGIIRLINQYSYDDYTLVFSKEENEFFNNKFNEYIDKASFDELMEMTEEFQKISYENHRVKETKIPISDISEEILQMLMKACNRASKEILNEKIIEDEFRQILYITSSENAGRPYIYGNNYYNSDYYTGKYKTVPVSNDETLKEISDILSENYDKPINTSEEYYIIYNTNIRFYLSGDQIKKIYDDLYYKNEWNYYYDDEIKYNEVFIDNEVTNIVEN